MAEDHRRERLSRGWLDLQRNSETGLWRLSWAPDPPTVLRDPTQNEPGWRGVTFSPGDGSLPADYPDPSDADALVEWGRNRFGG